MTLILRTMEKHLGGRWRASEAKLALSAPGPVIDAVAAEITTPMSSMAPRRAGDGVKVFEDAEPTDEDGER
jgi:hypothetical protein